MGMKSLIGLPNTHWAGESFVLGSGVLRYWSMACCSVFVSRLPCGSVLLVISHLTVFTPISARQFECGNATEDSRWCTPHSLRNCCVAAAVNSGPPSVAHSSGMPNITNVRRRQSISPFKPSCALSRVGQLWICLRILGWWHPGSWCHCCLLRACVLWLGWGHSQ